MRRNSLYELFSFHCLNMVRRALGMKSILYRKIVSHHYLKSFYDIPISENTALFDCFWGRKIGGDPYAIFRAMVLEKPDLKCVWVRNNGVSVPDDVASNPNVKFVLHDSKEYAEALLYSKYLIFNSNLMPYYSPKKEQVIINTWHGVPLKKLGLDISQRAHLSLNTQRNFNIADIIPVSSQYEFENVIRAYGATDLKKNVKYIGSPRIDLTITSDSSAVRSKIYATEGKKIILYAPTWRGSITSVSSQIEEQIKAIEYLEARFGAEFDIFVSLHHLTKHSLSKRKMNVKEVPDNVDINEMLSCADILISDYSSIIIDYLTLDRPTILYVPDLEEYTNERGLYFDLYTLPCLLAQNLSELDSAINLHRRPSYFRNYNEIMSLFLPNEDGLASKRVTDYAFSKGNAQHKKPKAKSVLIYPGSLKNNGITSSFKNLVSFLNTLDVKIYVLLCPAYEKGSTSFRPSLDWIRQRADVIFAENRTLKTATEQLAIRQARRGKKQVVATHTSIIEAMFKRETSRYFSDFQFDCVVDFSGYSPYWTEFLSHVSSQKRIVYQHSDMLAELEHPLRRQKHLTNVFNNYSRYDLIASVSAAIETVNARNLARYYGEAKSIALPNLMNFVELREKSQAPLNEILSEDELIALPKRGVCFISVSRLSPEKNLDVLLEALRLTRARGKDAYLIMVGDGPAKDELMGAAHALGVAESVIFTGHLDNPFPLLKRADCLLFPSIYEGQGLVLLEALGLGTYCIGSDIPAVREVLRGSGCPVVSPTPESFAQAMLDVDQQSRNLINFDSSAYMRNAARHTMAAYFGDSLGTCNDPVKTCTC